MPKTANKSEHIGHLCVKLETSTAIEGKRGSALQFRAIGSDGKEYLVWIQIQAWDEIPRNIKIRLVANRSVGFARVDGSTVP